MASNSNNRMILNCKSRSIDLSLPKVMGILNLTPDSFFDGGKYKTDSEFLKKTELMLKEGAEIIDIGAVSTRPDSLSINEDEEMKRITDPLQKIQQAFPEAIVSVDTYRSKVAKECTSAGAQMINDISGGTFDTEMFKVVSELKVPYCLMHIKGTPQNMQSDPVYKNVVQEIYEFFEKQLNKLINLGVTNNVILDPGFGFGKSLNHNYQLLGDIRVFQKLEFPVMAGISRKSMINKVLNTNPSTALNGTSILNTIALLNGVNILRVHDVKEAVEAIEIVNYYKSNQ